MHDVFEIAFRTHIATEAFVKFLAEYFRVEEGNIVPENVYWSEAMEGKTRIGFTVRHSSAGLMTNLAGISSMALSDLQLEDMAIEAARYFEGEAVIGDYRKSGVGSTGLFLSYMPDGAVWEAIDTSHGAISDVKILRKV